MVSIRIYSIFGKIIGPEQSSFIPKWQSQYNIIVAQEIFHSICNRKGKKGSMAIKIDLEKAFDRLRWEFIKETLEDIGLPNNLCTMIWHCISSVKMKLLWNEEVLEEFTFR